MINVKIKVAGPKRTSLDKWKAVNDTLATTVHFRVV